MAATTPARKRDEAHRRRVRRVAMVAAGLAMATTLIGTFEVATGQPAAAFCSVYDPCSSGGDPDPGPDPCGWECDPQFPEVTPPDTGNPGDPGGGGGEPTTSTVGTAVDKARTALESKPDCSTMITGPSQFTAQAILFTLNQNGHLQDKTSQVSPNQRPEDTIYGTTDIGQGSNGYLTLWQPFANPPATGGIPSLVEYNGKPLTQAPNWQDIFRVAAILHELGHATGAIGDDSGWGVGHYADNLTAIIDKCID